MQVKRSPDSLSHDRQTDKNNRRHYRPDDFEPVVAVRVSRALLVGVVTKFEYDPTQPDLRGRECYADYDDRDHELTVDRTAVFRDRFGKPPLPADEHPDRGDRDSPNCYSQKASHQLSPSYAAKS